jgi:hypothetical protein
LVSGRETSLAISTRAGHPEVIAVAGLDRAGNAGSSTVIQRASK